ncbi:MAG: sulfur carrier protein ThiS [Syntrophales bacterium]|nr:sulfur carrier protein ThiS [Syntrophales bacterium]
MLVKVNGSEITLNEKQTVREFLDSRDIKPETVVVELNRTILHRDEWNNTDLKENDAMEILSFVSGG